MRGRCGRGMRSLLFANGIENIARPGNVGKIDLGLDFIGGRSPRTRRLAGCVRFPSRAEVCAHLRRFVLFQRTGMCFLLGDADFFQHIENRFALDFQLSRQIVDSNLGHPPLFLPNLPLSLHINLTVLIFSARP